MSRQQIEACAKRLPEPERSHFLTEMDRATKLRIAAGAIASAAWARYRELTGRPRRDPPKVRPRQHGNE